MLRPAFQDSVAINTFLMLSEASQAEQFQSLKTTSSTTETHNSGTSPYEGTTNSRTTITSDNHSHILITHRYVRNTLILPACLPAGKGPGVSLSGCSTCSLTNLSPPSTSPNKQNPKKDTQNTCSPKRHSFLIPSIPSQPQSRSIQENNQSHFQPSQWGAGPKFPFTLAQNSRPAQKPPILLASSPGDRPKTGIKRRGKVSKSPTGKKKRRGKREEGHRQVR